jgi:hypothetical protein
MRTTDIFASVNSRDLRPAAARAVSASMRIDRTGGTSRDIGTSGWLGMFIIKLGGSYPAGPSIDVVAADA